MTDLIAENWSLPSDNGNSRYVKEYFLKLFKEKAKHSSVIHEDHQGIARMIYVEFNDDIDECKTHPSGSITISTANI
jgi:hypothetical protein